MKKNNEKVLKTIEKNLCKHHVCVCEYNRSLRECETIMN